MAQTAANLVEQVLPPVPLRQWVLTLPHPLRARLAYDGALLGAVARVFADSVLGWYRRRMDFAGITHGRSGAVVVIQRSSSDLALNPHLHGLFLDGVYRQDRDGELSFHPLPRLRTSEVSDVLQVVRVRLVRLLVRRGVLADDPELTMLAPRQARGNRPVTPNPRKGRKLRAIGPVTLSSSKGAAPLRSSCPGTRESRSALTCRSRSWASRCTRRHARAAATSAAARRSASTCCDRPLPTSGSRSSPGGWCA